MAYHHKVRSTIHPGMGIFPTSPGGKHYYSVIPGVSSQLAFSAINLSVIYSSLSFPLVISRGFKNKVAVCLKIGISSKGGAALLFRKKTELPLTFGVELPADCVCFLTKSC